MEECKWESRLRMDDRPKRRLASDWLLGNQSTTRKASLQPKPTSLKGVKERRPGRYRHWDQNDCEKRSSRNSPSFAVALN